MRWFPAMFCHAEPSSLVFFFFCRMLNFLGSIVIYTSKFQRVDCTLNWSYIHYGGLHCDSKYKQKIILVSNTRPLKFISAPWEAKHFIGQLWQLMTASNVGARTQAWQAKWAVFKIPGFVCKRFLPFFPTPSPLFYLRNFSRGQFDSRSSFFSPKAHRNACYAGYSWPFWTLLNRPIAISHYFIHSQFVSKRTKDCTQSRSFEHLFWTLMFAGFHNQVSPLPTVQLDILN